MLLANMDLVMMNIYQKKETYIVLCVVNYVQKDNIHLSGEVVNWKM